MSDMTKVSNCVESVGEAYVPLALLSDSMSKRLFDIVLSLVGLIVWSPVWALISLLIWLEDGFPVLISQERTGRGGLLFNLYKFRSMYLDASERRSRLETENEQGGHLFKMRSDPRVSRVGWLLRRFSLDELPQLINVLKGEMSLVGPRPLPAHDLPSQPQSTPHRLWLEQRRSVTPGVTGLWQVSGRSDLPFEEMVRLDLLYVEGWSLVLDLQILLRTLPVILRGKGAY